MGGTVGEWHKRRKLVGTNCSIPKQDRHYGSSKKDFVFINPVGVRARVCFHGLDLSNFPVINKAFLPSVRAALHARGGEVAAEARTSSLTCIRFSVLLSGCRKLCQFRWISGNCRS